MKLITLALAYLRARPLTTLLNVAMLSLGIATIVVLLLAAHQLGERMTRDARGIDMVLGAKGSPLQLVLAGIYHLDVPAGNIPIMSMKEIAKNPMVKQAIPLALGDAFRGYRIVGTDQRYLDLYGAHLASGKSFSKPLEAVLGAEVARATNVSVGQAFAGSHGLGEGGAKHEEAQYKVVGVLQPTGSVLDRLVLTDLASVWEVHEHKDDAKDGKAKEPHAPHADHDDDENREVTMVLIQYSTPLAAALLPRQLNARSDVQAAAPALELARLFRLVGVGVDVIKGFALILVISAALGVLVALSAALRERRYDLAVLRTLGASRRDIFALLIVEGALLALVGALLGVALGHALMALVGHWSAAEKSVPLTGALWLWQEAALIGGAVLLGVLAALAPAVSAYRTDVAAVLVEA